MHVAFLAVAFQLQVAVAAVPAPQPQRVAATRAAESTGWAPTMSSTFHTTESDRMSAH